MYVSEIANATLVRVKEYSTSTFQKFAISLTRIDFIRRNRRALAICIAVWLIVNVTGFFVYRSTVAHTNDEFYQQGMSAAEDLATKSGPFVLEKDVLALEVGIRELENMKNLKFAAITDHENTILTQTGQELAREKFEPSKNQITIAMIDDITITGGISPDNTKNIGFSKTITFSGVEIGKVYIALSTTDLYQTLNRLRRICFSGIFLAALVVVAVLFWFDWRARAKTLKVKQDLESTKP